MGYRNYLGKISIDKYNEIKNLNKEELLSYHKLDEDDYLSRREFISEVYELGKYVDNFSNDLKSPFFLREELNLRYNEDSELYLVEKKFFLEVINYYKRKIQTFYAEYAKGIREDNKETISKANRHIERMSLEWNSFDNTVINLDNPEQITGSWMYEYAIFQLVYLYNTFNWETDKLVYYGV
jgi:hypothetical protein